MKLNIVSFVQALCLLGFAFVIFLLDYFGMLDLFLDPNYISTVQIASVLFLFLFFMQWQVIGEKVEEKTAWWEQVLSVIILFIPFFAILLLLYETKIGTGAGQGASAFLVL